MKKVFEEPIIEILELNIVDVITVSDENAGEEDEF